MKRGFLTLVFGLMVGIALGVGSIAWADPIMPGFDLLQTMPGTMLGMIPLVGDPIGPGNTDTIVARLGGIDPFPVGGTGSISIQLVALSLMSADGSVHVGLTPGTLSAGRATIRHETAEGGTFDSFFDIFFDVTLRATGQLLDQGMVHLEQDGGMWSHTPPPGYPENPIFPSGRFFVVGRLDEHSPTERHVAGPAVPEPSTLLLLGSGLAGLGLAGWRRNGTK